MEKLKPCPFCGSEGVLFVSEDGGVMVICRKCNARTRKCIDTLCYSEPTNAVKSVIDAWNRRADDGK